jgi:peptidoglycan hydrolase-like protein with peptidoglycan-binding domain
MGDRYLSHGDSGKDVTALQRVMNRIGFTIRIDGEFGPETENAVRGFQRSHGLEVDGVAGPLTKAAMMGELRGGAPAPGSTAAPAPTGSSTPAPPTGGTPTGPAEGKDGKEGQPGPQGDTQTEQKLAQFFDQFNGIAIQVNPGEDPPRFVDVIPPYHINSGFRKDGAARERGGNRAVNDVINTLPVNARYGKATTADIKTFLETCIRRGLVSDTSAKGMRDFLAKYGISTDCSGLVSQALNHLVDGNMQIDKTDPLDPMNTGSGSLKGGQGQFDEVTTPRALTAGDTMHVPGHIRILIDVDMKGESVEFRTAESTPREDVVEESQRDANASRKADGGIGDVHWRYPNAGAFEGLQRSADGGRTWAATAERPTYGHWRRLG